MRFGTDGVRGVANTELTASFALRLGHVAADVLGVSDAVVGGDTRQSTPMLGDALSAGLASAGVDVRQLGVVPTPAVAFEASRFPDTLGVMVSASHNRYRDNGIKLFAPGGLKLTDDLQAEIEAALDAPGTSPDADAVGGIVDEHDRDAYRAHLLGAIEGRSLGGLRVVVDAANGAAFALGPDVLARAGADVVAIHADPDGRNINAGCGATAPGSLAESVVHHGADLGLALDGDADRLIAADHAGRIVDGDHIIAICAVDMRCRGRLRDDTVVVTVMTNLGFRLAMADAGIAVAETAVGDRYVLEVLERRGLSLGGEQSGHVIFPELSTTGDGILTGLVLADVVTRTSTPLAELAERAMTPLPQVLLNVSAHDGGADWTELLAADIASIEAQLGDRGRVLVRPSGTEPVVRVMVEALTAEKAERAARRLAAAVSAHESGGASGQVV